MWIQSILGTLGVTKDTPWEKGKKNLIFKIFFSGALWKTNTNTTLNIESNFKVVFFRKLFFFVSHVKPWQFARELMIY